MNGLLEFSVPLLFGFMVGFSFHGWLKDIQFNRKKESRLLIDIPFERQQGEAVFKELQQWNKLIEIRISYNKPLDTEGPKEWPPLSLTL